VLVDPHGDAVDLVECLRITGIADLVAML